MLGIILGAVLVLAIGGVAIAAAARGGGSSAGGKQLLTMQGTDTAKSVVFTVPDNWSLRYTYDCQRLGGDSNMVINEYAGDGTLVEALVNESGAAGEDTRPQSGDAGRRYLEVMSQCAWTVTVTGG